MKSFRNPFIHWSVSFLLLLGLTAHLLTPASGKVQKSAFAQWLDQHLVTDGGESEQSLRVHIRQLYSQYDEFPNFLKQATRLVQENRNDFRLPPRESREDTQENSLWLLQTWNLQRDLPGKMSASLIDPVKPVIKWVVSNHPFQGVPSPSGLAPGQLLIQTMPTLPAAINRFLTPLLSGMSINAP